MLQDLQGGLQDQGPMFLPSEYLGPMFQKDVSRFLGLFRALSCLVQNSRSGCGLFCWSFCLWVSKRWNHLRDQSSTYSHKVLSVSPVVLCQVAEMVRMETRAVSREFSDSKARAFAVTQKTLASTCFMQFPADLGGSFAQVDGPRLASNALRW